MQIWFDERVGTKTLKRVLLDRKIPKVPKWSWLLTLGSVSLFLFLVQAVTGIFLAMNYSPSTDHAYDSVQYIMGLPSGAFLRGLHVWGATFMVTAVFLHMFRVFIMGAYKFPREATWVTGVCMFLIVMGFGFTGYLLPWDQKAYWATVVGVRISEQAPYVGEYIGSIIKGGPNIGVRTLTRFFAFHGFFFTALFIALVISHLFLVVWHGIAGPPERMKRGDDRGN